MNISRNSREVKLNKLFTGINEATVNKLFDNNNFIEKSEGEIIYQTGDASNYIYLLLRGDVKIKFPNHHYVSNKIFNDFFGEKELIDKRRRISSAVADTRCLLYKIDNDAFTKLITNYDIIKKNIMTYGDIELPDIHSGSSAELSFAQNSKPISFKAIGEKDPDELKEKSSPESKTEEKSIESLSISDILNKENPFVSKELVDEINTSKPEQKMPTINIDGDPEIPVSIGNMDEEINAAIEETSKGIITPAKSKNQPDGKVNIKYLLATLLSIHSKNNLLDTIESVKNAVMQLTHSDACELFLVDSDAGSMKKYVKEGNDYKEAEFKFSDGLTGTAILQKKIINFEDPSVDSRFNPVIDLPSSEKFDRIIYFPVLNEGSRLVAVLQLARNEKAYLEQEISDLKFLANQIALAIERTKTADVAAIEEKQILLSDISKFLSRNIEIPIELINKYSSYLSKSEFSEKEKEIISMLQKQANTFWDIFKSTFDYTTNSVNVQPELLSLNTFINETSELLSEYCTARKVELFRKIVKDVNLNIDPGNIYMALYQIIITACDNSGENSNVYLGTEVEQDNAFITIRDEGNGYRQDEINAILSSSNKVNDGNLGLSLAKQFIELNNGEFTIESTEGKGTIFKIRFPLTTDDQNSQIN